MPIAIRVVMSCFVNGDCSECTEWNGTFDVPVYPACGAQPAGVGGACGFLLLTGGCNQDVTDSNPAILVELVGGGLGLFSVQVYFVTDFVIPSSPIGNCATFPPIWGYVWVWNTGIAINTCDFSDVPLYFGGYDYYCGPGPGCIYPWITAAGLEAACTWTTPTYPASCCTVTAIF
jgi:hypothetical protein